jgi:superfamily II DNA/RNA helicase
MNKSQRREILQDFTTEKKWILITTDLMARGLDFPKVSLQFFLIVFLNYILG